MKIFLFAIIIFLTSCKTLPNEILPSSKYIPCASIRAITYDSAVDTKLTVDEIRAFNAAYRALCL